MNKYQEAKETLEKYDYSTKLELSEGIRNNITSDITVEQFFVMKETCIELLDKETPMKTSKSHCGKCNIGYLVQSRGDKYCHVCGYKIDWSDDD